MGFEIPSTSGGMRTADTPASRLRTAAGDEESTCCMNASLIQIHHAAAYQADRTSRRRSRKPRH